MPQNTSEHKEENDDDRTGRRQGSIVHRTDHAAQWGRGLCDTKTYTCVACGDDRLTGEPGAEVYFTEMSDGVERAMCRWCIDRSKNAERAVKAALRDAGPSEVTGAMFRVLLAWAKVDAERELYQARHWARKERDGADEWTRNSIDA